jgi:hypothetical protein
MWFAQVSQVPTPGILPGDLGSPHAPARGYAGTQSRGSWAMTQTGLGRPNTGTSELAHGLEGLDSLGILAVMSTTGPGARDATLTESGDYGRGLGRGAGPGRAPQSVGG